MVRGLTPGRTASWWPLQSRGCWLVMMAVIRWRRAGRCGPAKAEVLRWGRRLLARVAALSRGGVPTVTVIVVMALTACGLLVAVVEVAGGGAFDLAGAEAGTAGGQQVARTARPMTPARSAGPCGQIP
jgi:hypothetical protein